MKDDEAVAAAGGLGSTGVPPVPAGVPPGGPHSAHSSRCASAIRRVDRLGATPSRTGGTPVLPARLRAPSRLAGALALFVTLAGAFAENTKNFYQHPVAGANGGLSGTVDQPITHALALAHDHISCFKGDLGADGKSFKITGLPTGKYDLIFVTKSAQVYEGLDLGEQAVKLTGVALKHLEERVSLADNFFNKAHLHRYAISEDGEKLFGFIERIRDRATLTQGGETMKVNLRRFDVTEFAKAQDDWMMVNARHVYREETPQIPNMPFAPHYFKASLGNFRVIDSNKDLGSLQLAP